MKLWIRFSQFIQKNLIIALPAAMLGGLAFGSLVNPAFLKAWMLPLTFMLVFPMMVGFDLRQLAQKGTVKLQIVAQALNFAVFPFIAYGMGLVIFPDEPALQAGLLLSALLPTSGMTVTWTGLAKGPVPVAVQLVLVGLIAGTVATPFYMKALLGAEISLSLAETLVQMLYVVIVPLFTGALLRVILIRMQGKDRFEKDTKPLFPGLSTVAILLVVFIAIALRARIIVSQPLQLWSTFWPVAVFYLVNFVLVTLVGRRFFERGHAIALVYGTVMRNLSIALALALTFLGEAGGSAALVITWAYVIQVQGAAWYLKLIDKVLVKTRKAA